MTTPTTPNPQADVAREAVDLVTSPDPTMAVYRRITADRARIDVLEGENARLREALVMAVVEMSRARGRLETIAMCNEDRRIAAALGGTCDFARTALTSGSTHEPQPAKDEG